MLKSQLMLWHSSQALKGKLKHLGWRWGKRRRWLLKLIRKLFRIRLMRKRWGFLNNLSFWMSRSISLNLSLLGSSLISIASTTQWTTDSSTYPKGCTLRVWTYKLISRNASSWSNSREVNLIKLRTIRSKCWSCLSRWWKQLIWRVCSNTRMNLTDIPPVCLELMRGRSHLMSRRSRVIFKNWFIMRHREHRLLEVRMDRLRQKELKCRCLTSRT